MVDEQRGPFGRSHNCEHTIYKMEPNVTGGVRHLVGDPYGIGWYDELSSHCLLSMAPGIGVEILTPLATEVDWQTESWEAWDRMRPQIETEISALNFLFELKDMKKLVDLWSKRRSRIKNTANAHLNYSFGWAPLISDTERVLSLMVDFNTKWNALVANANKLHKKHISRVLKGELTSEKISDTGDSTWEYRATTVHQPIKYTATAMYRYTIPLQWRGLPAKFVGLMDAYGLNLNPAIIWNAIPYSFAVDWIFGVGQWLDRWSVDALTLNVELVDFCHSVKRESSRDVYAYNAYPDGFLNEVKVYSERASHYVRQVSRPSMLGLPRVKSPRWGAVALATSLVASKSGRPKSTRRARLFVPNRIFVPRNHTGH